jgi:sterol desaturase/sphingolipid hydroxylase (fatty acid hydroxylase superfamily)
VEKIKPLAFGGIGLLSAFGLLALTGSTQLQQLLTAHASAPLKLPLLLLLAIPTGIVTLVCAYLIEGAVLGWRNSSLRNLSEASGSVRLDVLCVVLEQLSLKRLGYVLSLGLLYVLETRSTQPLTLLPAHLPPSWGLQVGCLLLLGSLISYWVHRLEHSIPALWALHKFHHSADRMSVLTSHRQTDFTRTVEQALATFPLLLFAIAEPTAPKPGVASALFPLVAIYFFYRAFIRVNQYLVHSNLTTDYGWIGRWLLVSPRMHRLHHARAVEYHHKNFTFDLVIWDRIFGTYATCEAADVSEVPIGLDDNPYNHTGTVKGVLRDYFLTPYIVFWRALKDGTKAWLPMRSAGTR